jgi:hypothetical protein
VSGLCTLSELRAWRGANDPNATTGLDEIFKLFILATSDYFEKHCHRVLRRQEYTEYLNGNNETWKYLSEPNRDVPLDVTAPFTLHRRTQPPVTETLIAATRYEVFDDGKIIYTAGFDCGQRNYKAVYTVGFDTTGWETIEIGGSQTFGVPDILRKACAMQTAMNLKKPSGRLGDARLGLTSKGLIETELIAQYITGIEPEVAEMIKQYVKVMY